MLSGEQRIGQVLQQMREISDPPSVLEHARHLACKPYDFVSYRLRDGTRAAYRKVLELITEGTPVWWDRWSLPRSLAERGQFIEPAELDPHVLERIRRARVVWAIRSPLYGEPGSYSRLEWKAAGDKLEWVPPRVERRR